jgi:hypothetical protein
MLTSNSRGEHTFTCDECENVNEVFVADTEADAIQQAIEAGWTINNVSHSDIIRGAIEHMCPECGGKS